MPKLERNLEEAEENLAVERRLKSFTLRNLSYREALKAVGRDTLIVLSAVALLLGLKRLYRVLFKGESFKSALRDYVKRDLKEALEEASKTLFAGALYILLRRGGIKVFRNISLLKVILFVEVLSAVLKNFLSLKRGEIDGKTFLRITVAHTLLTAISLYGTSLGAMVGYHLAKELKSSPLVWSILFGFLFGIPSEWLGRKLLKLWRLI